MTDSTSDNETVGSTRDEVQSVSPEDAKQNVQNVIREVQSLNLEEKKDVTTAVVQSLTAEEKKALIQTLQQGASGGGETPMIFDERILDPWVRVINKHSDLAQKDVYATIPSILGIVILVLALTARFVPAAAWAVGLSSSDFIAILLVGTLLIITGAVVRLYSYKWGLQAKETAFEKSFQLVAEENRTEPVGKMHS